MAVIRLCTQMANCKVGDAAKVVSGRPDYIGLKVRCVREVTQEELVESGLELDKAPFWDTGLTVKRKGKLVQVWTSDHNLKPI